MQKRRGEERQAEEKGRRRKAEEKGTGGAVRTEESNFWHLTSVAVANSTNPMPRDFPLSLSVGKRIESGEKPESCAAGASSKWDKTCSNTNPSYNDGKRGEGREGTELSYGVRRPEGMEGGNRKGERGGREGCNEGRVGREGEGEEGKERGGKERGRGREGRKAVSWSSSRRVASSTSKERLPKKTLVLVGSNLFSLGSSPKRAFASEESRSSSAIWLARAARCACEAGAGRGEGEVGRGEGCTEEERGPRSGREVERREWAAEGGDGSDARFGKGRRTEGG